MNTRTLVLLLLMSSAAAAQPATAPAVDAAPSSSAILAQLPEGETKRQFIIDCTNCHQFSAQYAYKSGAPRTVDEWATIVTRMNQYAGATTGFPIISAGRDPLTTAQWLSRYLTGVPSVDVQRAAAPHRRIENANVVEYLLPQAQDLAHDVAVDSSGRILVTGMFSHVMYVLDTVSRSFAPVALPVARANPRAAEIAPNGDWWVLLGGPRKLLRRRASDSSWQTFDVGFYGHSVALRGNEGGWVNGHFTRDPERIVFADTSGGISPVDAPRHPTMATTPGGPIPYELRLARNGTVWMSELQGHRMLAYEPGGAWRTYELPTSISAPRRFDVAADGIVWIPNYAANSLARLDPASGAVREIPLPTPDAVPYVARVNGGAVWVGTNASDEVYRYDIAGDRWTTYRLPTPGAVIRHLVIHPRNGDVWLAFGGSPGIPSRIARLRP